MNSERIWKETDRTYSRYFPGIHQQTEKNHKNLRHNSRLPGWESKRIPPEYKSGALPLHSSIRSMHNLITLPSLPKSSTSRTMQNKTTTPRFVVSQKRETRQSTHVFVTFLLVQSTYMELPFSRFRGRYYQESSFTSPRLRNACGISVDVSLLPIISSDAVDKWLTDSPWAAGQYLALPAALPDNTSYLQYNWGGADACGHITNKF